MGLALLGARIAPMVLTPGARRERDDAPPVRIAPAATYGATLSSEVRSCERRSERGPIAGNDRGWVAPEQGRSRRWAASLRSPRAMRAARLPHPICVVRSEPWQGAGCPCNRRSRPAAQLRRKRPVPPRRRCPVTRNSNERGPARALCGRSSQHTERSPRR